MADVIEADVIIVGSGVAGALLAARLAQAGARVAILEAGDEVDRATALDRFLRAPIKVPESAYPPVPEAPHPVAHRPGDWYGQDGPDAFSSTYLKAVGGTTWHWLGTALRFLPQDFRMRAAYGVGLDWPFALDELAPFYAEAESELGVSGDAAQEAGGVARAAYPMPAIPQTYQDRLLAAKLEGSPYRVSPTPQARNAVERGGRPACCGSASCIPVCPIQAKYDATVHVRQAVAAGARLFPRTTAVRVETGPDRRVSGIRFRRWDGSEGRATGQAYVLAAHGIETPRLLLHSAGDANPRGVANSSDQVGRNLMDHPTQMSWALANEPVYPYRGPLSTSGIENLRDGEFRGRRGAFRIEIGNDGWSWPNGAPVSTAREFAAQGLRGAALATALREHAARHVRLASLVEQLPDAGNRVSLDPVRRDANGVPLPRITFRLDDYVRAGLEAARAAHADIFARLGTTGLRHAERVFGAGHIMGTWRMGTDPRTSVVDPQLRSHDHRNLFLVGSGAFPTSATANPTLTIAALALRAARPVLETLRG
ncbi:MAG TPA: GMC family oxidoreductase [Roseococcus sp.]|jgi:choline dehydrogenase-like flavoprotein|nr:GMC family oxidoreductase [Roseococcus sp.]